MLIVSGGWKCQIVVLFTLSQILRILRLDQFNLRQRYCIVRHHHLRVVSIMLSIVIQILQIIVTSFMPFAEVIVLCSCQLKKLAIFILLPHLTSSLLFVFLSQGCFHLQSISFLQISFHSFIFFDLLFHLLSHKASFQFDSGIYSMHLLLFIFLHQLIYFVFSLCITHFAHRRTER